MTSQSSTNKKTAISFWNLLLEDIRQKPWMSALSILGSFLAGPIMFLFTFTNGYSFRNGYYKIIGDVVYSYEGNLLMTLNEYYLMLQNSCMKYFNGLHTVLMAIIAYMGAIIVATYGFQYLYKKRMVDLYHSSPVSRKTLFAVSWLDGFLIWLVPALICNLVTFVEAGFFLKGRFIGSLFGVTLLSFLKQTLIFLIVYHVFLVGTMLSGNIINAFLNGCTYGLLAIGLVGTVLILKYGFYDHFYLPTNEVFLHPLYVFSPLATPIILLMKWYGDFLSSQGLYLYQLIGSIVIMLFNLALAFFLYLKRPSELAERGLECKPVRVVFRVLLSILSGIMFATGFYEISSHSIPWIIFGAILGSALAYCILNIVYHVNFKEIFSHKLQYVIVLIGTLGLFFSIMFDVTGYDSYLPSAESITGLQLYVSGLTDQSYYYNYSSAFDRYELSMENGVFVSTDGKQIHSLLEACLKDDQYNGYRFYLTVKVKTKHGSYYRSYILSYDDVDLLAPFVETKAYLETFYPMQTNKIGKTPSQLTLNNSLGQSKVVSDSAQVEEFMQAMYQDFADHSKITDLLKRSRRFAVTVWYLAENELRNSYTLNIPYEYERTIAVVERWFPDFVWDPKAEDVTELNYTIDFNIPKDADVHEALYNYFGYDANGTPLSAPTRRLQTYENIANISLYDNKTEDVEFLQAIAPYLIWGNYSNQLDNEYVLLGQARYKNGEFKDGGHAAVYVRYGTLPLSVLDYIEQNIERISAYDESQADEYIPYDGGLALAEY